MKQIYYIVLATVVLLASCNGGSRSNNGSSTPSSGNADPCHEESYAPGTREVEVDFDLSSISNYEEYRRAIDRYWDGFDFAADTLVVAYDTTSLTEAFANYVVYIEPERADSLLRELFHRAERSRPVLDLFSHVAEVVLHDPNSPLRNDEYYIPILETLLDSPRLDEYAKIVPAYDLDLACKNRIGTQATDFVYTLENGRTGRLHNLRADYVILMFSNPGCPMCHDLMLELTASPLICELSELGRLKVLNIYPDADLVAWRAYLGELPHSWINAYDNGMTLSNERLYNLNAIPSLYLLDSQKRVLVKDGTNVAQIENTIALAEAER